MTSPQRLDVLQLHLLECAPITLAGSRVEELDPRKGHTERSIRVIQLVLHMQKKTAELILGDLVG